MRNIIISTISILSLITLTACTGSADGGDTPAANANANPPVTETPMDTETPMETPMKTDDLFPPIVTTGVPTQDLDGVTSFAPDDAHLKHIIALPVASMAQITTDTTDNSITTNNITGGAISYRYADGSFDTGFNTTSKAPRLYIGSSIYQVTAGTSSNLNSVSSTTVEIDDTEVAGATLRLFRNDSFGFIANYMARLDWVVGDTKGYGIAGFETGLHGGTLLNSGTTTFTGKGQGTYSDSDTSNLTLGFNITANVDLGTRMVTLESDTTCQIDYQGCPLNDANEYYNLNFKGSANYTSGTNALNFTNIATAGDDKNFDADDSTELNGVASARFYGGLTNEIGGTFNLINSDNSAGYVGFFGGERGWVISANDAVTTTTDGTDPSLNTNSLANFTDSPKNGTTGNALSADFVQITRNSVDKSINNDIFTNGVVVFDYAGSNFATSGTPLTIYFGETKYEMTAGSSSTVTAHYLTNSATGGINNTTGTDGTKPTLSFNKSDAVFGFVTNYMARVSWIVNETGYDAYGYGIAGFETATPLTAGTTIFTGEGGGYYSDSSANTSISFDVNATVDFGNRTVALASINTCNKVVMGQVLVCGTQRADLNFTASLDYGTTDMAKFTGNDLAFDNVETTSGLTGSATAKFYGPQSNELGGTFNLTSATAGYVGFFGGARYIIEATDTTTDATIDGDTVPVDFTLPFTSFIDSTRSGETGNAFQIDNLVSFTHDSANATVTTDIISGGVVAYDYVGTSIKTDSLTAYFGDTKYRLKAGIINGLYQSSGGEEYIVSLGNTPVTSNQTAAYTIQLTRTASAFNITPNYMALIEWSVDDDNGTLNGNQTYQTTAYGIFGFKTDGGNIPKFGENVSFTGAGQGRYSDGNLNTDGSNTTKYYFDINANVDFSARTVELSSTNTCLRDNHCTATFRPDLDFTGTLTYADGDNDLSTTNTGGVALTTKGGAYAAYTDTDGVGTDFSYDASSTASLTGDANAKFYGPASNEFGGTFSLTNGLASYAGYFGTERTGWLVTTQVKATQATYYDVADSMTKNVPAEVRDGHTGFNVAGETLTSKTISLKMSNAVQTSRDATAETIINHHYTGGVSEITYDASGNITSVSAYFDDKKYGGENNGANLYPTSLTSTNAGLKSSDDLNLTGFSLSRSAIYNLGFAAKYMASMNWSTGDYNANYAITGFETANIPVTQGTVEFTGQGRGYYNSPIAGDSVLHYLNVTATVDFTVDNIAFSTSNTCVTQPNCSGNAQKYHLNMKGTLDYTAGTNSIAGTVKTAGDDLDFESNTDGTELTGTANARFYGPNAEELGGTFSVSNENSSFTGFFGADNPNN